ncbi:MAG: type II toxin-antitoxin system RelE family toxin [Candidatus Saccharimonadales bacterium]
MGYTIKYRASVKKELKKIGQPERAVIVKKILLLEQNPLPKGSTKLKGSQNLYRFRCGVYRVIYQLNKGVLVIIIIRVGNRRDAYRNL